MELHRKSATRVWAVAVVVTALLAGGAACSDDEPATAPGAVPTARPSAGADPSTSSTAAATQTPSAGGTSSPDPGAPPSTPAGPRPALPPAPLDEPADAGDGVVVELVRTVSVKTQGTGPGESSGEPAVAVTLRVRNGSEAPLDLSTSTVSLTTGPQRIPGRFSEGPPARPLTGQVLPGDSAEGVYVFALPPGERGDVVLDVGLAPGRPVLQLVGSLAQS